jgi:Ca2+-binding EF-hand superfamily protein
MSGKGTNHGHNKDKLLETFKSIDTDNSGQLTGDELIKLFRSMGDSKDLAKKRAKEILINLDKDYDNKISWSEFKAGMK